MAIHTTWKRRFCGLMAACALAITVGSLQPAAASASAGKAGAAQSQRRAMSGKQLSERLKQSTCNIRVFKYSEKLGRNTWFGGTGFLLNRDRKEIVTNHHVVKGAIKIEVTFPVKRNGEWETDENYYRKHVRPSNGTVVKSKQRPDLALVKLDRLPAHVRELPLAANRICSGEKLYVMGGNPRAAANMWQYCSGEVRAVGKGIIESMAPVNPGNSGGPAVNDRGEVVGVVFATTKDELRVQGHSYIVGLQPLKTFLASPASQPRSTPSGIAGLFPRKNAPGNSGTARAGQIAGSWRTDNGLLSLSIKSDGRFTITIREKDGSEKTAAGTWALNGTELTLTIDGEQLKLRFDGGGLSMYVPQVDRYLPFRRQNV